MSSNIPLNLVGKWKLVRDGSDFYPGLDALPDAPLVLKLLGNNDVEFYRIEKKKYIDIEELDFTYVTKGVSSTRAYQVGVLNYESLNGNDVVVSILHSIDDHFKEFSLVRLGPKSGQYSRELYKYDINLDQIKLQIEFTTNDGVRFNLIKYLTRFDDGSAPALVNMRFAKASHTNGWKLFEYWPSAILSNAQVKIVQAIRVKFQDSQARERTKVLETTWSESPNDSGNEKNIEWSTSPRSFLGKSTEGEDVVQFLIKVTIGESSWFVAHRYNEFDILRKFLLAQNPFNKEFQECDNRFPGKLLGLAYRRYALESRIEGLSGFLSFYAENSRFCRQNSIDAICAFLQIPDHLHAVAMSRSSNEAAMQNELSAIVHTSTGGTVQVSAGALAAVAATGTASSTTNTNHNNNNHSNTAGASSASAGAGGAVYASQQNTSTTITGGAGGGAGTATGAAATSSTSPAIAGATAGATGAGGAGAATTATTTTSPAGGATSSPASTTTGTATVGVAATGGNTAGVAGTAMTVISNDPAIRDLVAFLKGDGIQIIKHGRQGAPKHRQFSCDDEGTHFVVQASETHYKKVLFSEIEDVRLGSEVDPASPPEAIAKYNAEKAAGTATANTGKANRRASIRMSMLGGDKETVLFGTAILRRTCKAEDMRLCISFLSKDRTVDIQCTDDAQFNQLRDVIFKVFRKAPVV